MRFVFSARDDAASRLRSRLFIDTLRDHVAKSSAHQIVEDLPGTDASAGLASFEALAALEPDRHAETTVFVGLPRSPAQMTGRNILICPRPLEDELGAFASTIGRTEGASDLWPATLLSAFAATIFLERYDLQQSRGFAPWCPLKLADRFPLHLPAQPSEPQSGIALFLHDPDASGTDPLQPLTRLGPVYEITAATSDDALAQALARSAVHVHVGWSPKCETIGLSPLDSLCSGAYSLIALPPESDDIILGRVVIQMFEERGYAEISRDPAQWADTVAALLKRARGYRDGGFRINPEIARHASANAAFVAERINRLEEMVLS